MGQLVAFASFVECAQPVITELTFSETSDALALCAHQMCAHKGASPLMILVQSGCDMKGLSARTSRAACQVWRKYGEDKLM